MAVIKSETTLQELAVIVSSTLEEAGIIAALSGGAAVSIFSDNAYESADLDFITSEGKKALQAAVKDIGFTSKDGSRMFEHPDTDWYLEFPPGPLGFGDAVINAEDIPLLSTQSRRAENNYANTICNRSARGEVVPHERFCWQRH